MHTDFDIVKTPELFYYSMLMFYKPWRKEADIMDDSESYESEFLKVYDNFPEMKRNYDRKMRVKKARQEMDEKVTKEAEAQGNKDDENSEVENDSDFDAGINQFLEEFEENNKKSTLRTEEDLQERVALLNKDQRHVYNMVTAHLSHVLQHIYGKCDTVSCKKVEPLYLFCSGPGGTGKTFLLEAIVGYMYVETQLRGRVCDSILCAPSGLAASNINGSTIHSTFSVPVEHGSFIKYNTLNKRVIDEMRAVMKNLRCIIVDEVSMVSNVLLMFMDLRMGEVFDPEETFGGVKTFIAFGDLLQLPPVKAEPPFLKLTGELVGRVTVGSKTLHHVWSKFKYVELTLNQRQKGDQNSEWRAILSRFRLGIKLPSDMNVLNERCIKIKGENIDEKLDSIIEYFCTLLNSGENATCLLPTRSMTDNA